MSDCKTCDQYRKEMGEALSQGAMIKAAKIAMAGAAEMARHVSGKASVATDADK